MDIRTLLDTAPYDDIRDVIARLAASADPSALDSLKEFLVHRDDHTYYKHAVPRLACLALLQKGVAGVEVLSNVFSLSPGSIYPEAIIEALWHAANGKTPVDSVMLQTLPPVPPLDGPLPTGTSEAAELAVRDLVAGSVDDEDRFDRLVGFLFQENMRSGFLNEQSRRAFRSRVLDVFAAGRIRLTGHLVKEFERMLASGDREERYQQFLTENAVFLDPLAAQVIPKQRLGIEYTTDFVIRRLDDKYVVVEIEKPQDELFTQSDDFSFKFTHALGQVLDFQQWINPHAEYARSLMPQISAPRGLLIMGRAERLSERQKAKLHRFNVNSATIEVLTFDDVAANARRLLENIYRP